MILIRFDLLSLSFNRSHVRLALALIQPVPFCILIPSIISDFTAENLDFILWVSSNSYLELKTVSGIKSNSRDAAYSSMFSSAFAIIDIYMYIYIYIYM